MAAEMLVLSNGSGSFAAAQDDTPLSSFAEFTPSHVAQGRL